MKKKITEFLFSVSIFTIAMSGTVYATPAARPVSHTVETFSDDTGSAEPDTDTFSDDAAAGFDTDSLPSSDADNNEGAIRAIAEQVEAQSEKRVQEYREAQEEADQMIAAQKRIREERRKESIRHRAEVKRRIQEEAQRKLEEKKRRKEEAQRKIEEEKRRKEEARLARRQEIVNFALQFEGNPYVYGGTSLTNGADCSGFVMSVFANFGYSLPRVAAAQCEASTKKDLKDMEPGDLVFYGGSAVNHVALYIGDGQIIHASTSATGIKISDYDYQTPTAIGTYLP